MGNVSLSKPTFGIKLDSTEWTQFRLYFLVLLLLLLYVKFRLFKKIKNKIKKK